MKLAIYGTGSVGLPVKAIADKIGKWDEIIFVDDTKPAGMYQNCTMLPFEEFKMKYSPKEIEFVIAVGTPAHRKLLYDRVKKEKYKFTNLISPDVTISDDVKLGKGIIIERSSFLGFGVTIEDNVFLSGAVCVNHDSCVGKHSVILQCTVVGGLTKIGSVVFVGQNSTIRDRITIGDNSIISMAAAVFKDVPSKMIVMGNPARVISKNEGELIFK